MVKYSNYYSKAIKLVNKNQSCFKATFYHYIAGVCSIFAHLFIAQLGLKRSLLTYPLALVIYLSQIEKYPKREIKNLCTEVIIDTFFYEAVDIS